MKFEFNLSEEDFEDDNIIDMNFGEDYPIKLNPNIEGGELDKKGSLSPDGKSIEWEVIINRNYDDMGDITIEDTLPEGLELDGKIEITAINNNGTPVGEKKEASEFPVNIDNVKRPYKLKYRTNITGPFTSFENKVKVKIEGTDKEANDIVEANKDNIKKTGKIVEEDGKKYIEWEIKVNEKGLAYENLIIEDTFGPSPKQVFVKGSLKVDPDIKSKKFESKNNGFTLELGETSKSHTITYRTELKDLSVSPGQSIIVNNKVTTSDKDKENTKLETDANVNYYRNKLVQKWGVTSGEDDEGNKLAHWTVTVNQDKEEIPKGTIIKDKAFLDGEDKDPLTLKEGSFQIRDNDGNFLKAGEDYELVENPEGLWEIRLLKPINTILRIEYDTIVDPNHELYVNEVEIDLKGTGVIDDNISSPLNPQDFKDAIYKDFEDYDFNKGEITWKVDIYSKSGNFKTLKIRDKMSSNLNYVEGSLTISLDGTDLVEAEDYIFGFDKDKTMEIELTEEGLKKSKPKANSIVKLRYKAKFDPEITGEDSLRNKVGATLTTEKSEKEHYIEDSKIIPLENWIVKNGKKIGALDYKNNVIHWEVYLNPKEGHKKNDKLIDEMSKGQKFDPESLKIYTYRFDKVSSAPHIVRELLNPQEYEISSSSDDKFEVQLYIENERLLVKYDTKLVGLAEEEYSNKITVGEDTFEDTVNFEDWDKFIDKKGDFEINGVLPQDELHWTLEVNESYSELKNLVITDEISGGHEYLDGTLKILDRKGKEIKKDFTYEGGKLVIDMGNIHEAYTISYSTYVTGDGKNIKTLGNKVSMESDGKDAEDNEFENVEIHAIGSGGGSGVLRGSLELTKVDEEGSAITGNPAKFKLSRILSNGKVVDVENPSPIGADKTIFETNDQGKLEIGNLNKGKYILTEVEPPKGYEILKGEIEFEISKDQKKFTVNVKNDKIAPGHIKIEKVDHENRDIKLAGAEFDLYDMDENKVGSIVTGVDGIGSIELPLGDYILVETKAPVGYQLSNPVTKIPVESVEGELETIEAIVVENYKETEKLGILEILKIEKDTVKTLAGAEFDVYNEDGTTIVDHIKTDENGKAEANLPYGKYKLKETKAPEGYKLLEGFIDVEVTGARKPVIETIENERAKGFIKIEKVDHKDNDKKLAGAEFTVYDQEGEEVETIVTDDDGKASIELPTGKYTLVETKAPKDYQLPSPAKTFFVTVEEGTEESVEAIVVENYENNVPLGLLRLIKLDKDSDLVLAGAEFDVYKEDGKTLVAHIRTDEKGLAYAKLPYGDYKLKETKAPEGYKLLEGLIDAEVTGAKAIGMTKVDNEKLRGRLEIKKLDSKDKTKTLAGAEFEIIDESGSVVRTIETDENGRARVFGLEYGSYTLRETKAPKGYEKLSKDIEFRVEREGQKIFFEIENTKLDPEKPTEPIEPIEPEEPIIPTYPHYPQEPSDRDGLIKLEKLDGETGQALAGAEFEVRDEKGRLVGSIRTDKNGKGQLRVEYGEYTIVETKAPKGYIKLDNSIGVVLKKSRPVVTELVENIKDSPELPEDPKDPEKPTEPVDPGEDDLVSEDGDGSVVDDGTGIEHDGEDIGSKTETEEPGGVKLPKTGANFSMIYLLLGAILVFAGLYLNKSSK